MVKSLQHWAEAWGVWAEPLPLDLPHPFSTTHAVDLPHPFSTTQAAGGARQGRQRVVSGPWTGEGQGTVDKGAPSRRRADDEHVEARRRRVTESRVSGGKDGEASVHVALVVAIIVLVNVGPCLSNFPHKL